MLDGKIGRRWTAVHCVTLLVLGATEGNLDKDPRLFEHRRERANGELAPLDPLCKDPPRPSFKSNCQATSLQYEYLRRTLYTVEAQRKSGGSFHQLPRVSVVHPSPPHRRCCPRYVNHDPSQLARNLQPTLPLLCPNPMDCQTGQMRLRSPQALPWAEEPTRFESAMQMSTHQSLHPPSPWAVG